MRIKTIQDILPLIEKPSRYLGSEINSIKKDHKTVNLRVALAFPEMYEIGTSHFGLQILYHILNQQDDIVAERVYSPGADMEAYLRASKIPLMTLETQTPLNQYDIIGFSLLYELNYTNILNMLDLGNIPFFASQRDASFPLVIAGGPCTCNPEPIAEIFDAIVIGDGEDVIMKMVRKWLKWRENAKKDKEALLHAWAKIDGVYIPAFFEPDCDEDGLQTAIPKFSSYTSIKKAVLANLDQAPFPNMPIIPHGKPVHDRLRLEVSRGCTRGCRFCQAGMIYRPVRERSPETLLSLLEQSLAATGYEDISLLSLSTGDYQCIIPLMQQLMVRCSTQHTAVSLPSIRAGTLTSEMMTLIKQVRKTGFTLAPEAGSQRLRSIINKDITNQDVIDTVNDAFKLGWRVIKLYFMVGFPTETEDDLKAIVDLLKALKKIKRPNGALANINVSVSTFIPKPHTPFQWAPQISLTESKEKIAWLKAHLRKPGIRYKWQNPEASLLEGLWARGDRQLSRLLVAAFNLGCKFDGWNDSFSYSSWERAISQTGIDIDKYTTRTRLLNEPLPWDHIDMRVSKTFLKTEWEKAINGQFTPDCRWDACQDCGVCDFKRIELKLFDKLEKISEEKLTVPEKKQFRYHTIQIVYSKDEHAQYFGHLEVINIFSRAIRRANIPIKYTKGFHPKPKMSFDDPLPVGIVGKNETMYLEIPEHIELKTVIKRLNDSLPPGFTVQDAKVLASNSEKSETTPTVYRVQLKDNTFDEDELLKYLTKPKAMISRTNRKGKTKKIDLKENIVNVELSTPSEVLITLKKDTGTIIRPFEVIKYVFSLSEENIKQATVIKIA